MLSFLGTIGKMLPGYVQGERQAVQDNWSDLDNYNKVQSGQIQNALDESLFNPRLQMFNDAVQNSSIGLTNNAMNLYTNIATYNDRLNNALLQSRLSAPMQLYQFSLLPSMLNSIKKSNNVVDNSMSGIGLSALLNGLL